MALAIERNQQSYSMCMSLPLTNRLSSDSPLRIPYASYLLILAKRNRKLLTGLAVCPT